MANEIYIFYIWVSELSGKLHPDRQIFQDFDVALKACPQNYTVIEIYLK